MSDETVRFTLILPDTDDKPLARLSAARAAMQRKTRNQWIIDLIERELQRDLEAWIERRERGEK